MARKPKTPRRVRLKCACCGGEAGFWVQWPNRDKGYGVCVPCVNWMLRPHRGEEDSVRLLAEAMTHIEESYGKRGINWGNEKDE